MTNLEILQAIKTIYLLHDHDVVLRTCPKCQKEHREHRRLIQSDNNSRFNFPPQYHDKYYHYCLSCIQTELLLPSEE